MYKTYELTYEIMREKIIKQRGNTRQLYGKIILYYNLNYSLSLKYNLYI